MQKIMKYLHFWEINFHVWRSDVDLTGSILSCLWKTQNFILIKKVMKQRSYHLGRLSLMLHLKPLQPSVAFHIETSHLLCRKKQMAGFYMKRNTGLEWVKVSKASIKVIVFKVVMWGIGFNIISFFAVALIM